MTVLFILDMGFDSIGPSVHLMADIIEQTLIAGHNVRLISRNRGGTEPDMPTQLQKYAETQQLVQEIIYDKSVKKSAYFKRYIDDILYCFRCRKKYKRYRDVDVVFLQSCTSPLFPITLIHQTLHRPVLFNVQNIFPIDALAIHKLSQHGIKGLAFYMFRKMQQLAYQRADYIVTISEDMKKTLIGEKVPENKIDVICNWGYTDVAKKIPDSENLFLKNHPEAQRKFRVVFSGNMGAQVNAELIAESAELLKQYEEIHFFIIGDGANMPKLKQMAKDKNLQNMSFYPYQPPEFAPHNYAMAHVGINALPKGIVYTCMPSKTAQMLNAARPIVSSIEKDSWLASILMSVDKSVVVDVDDSIAFSQEIVNIYENKNWKDSSNARAVCRQLCSKENAKIYVTMLENTAKRVVRG